LLWVPSHAGILGNEIADFLATSCACFISSLIKIPYFDFSPALKAFTLRSETRKWLNLLPSLTTFFVVFAPLSYPSAGSKKSHFS